MGNSCFVAHRITKICFLRKVCICYVLTEYSENKSIINLKFGIPLRFCLVQSFGAESRKRDFTLAIFLVFAISLKPITCSERFSLTSVLDSPECGLENL